MSRARDMANLGAQAGSGLDASDITTGTLGNTVQDNITRLGTVTTGTLKNTIHSDATFPAGTIINTYYSQYVNNATINIIQAVADPIVASNTDSLVSDGVNQIFNVDNRTFAKVVSKTVNIASGNGVIVHGWCGGDASTNSSRGAYGFVFKVPDASGNNRGYQAGNYPHYQASNMPQYMIPWAGSMYTGPGTGNSNDTIGTGNIEIAIYGFAYNESVGSGTQTIRISYARMIIHEVQL